MKFTDHRDHPWMPQWPDWVLDAQIWYGHEGEAFETEGYWDNPRRGIVNWYIAGSGQGGQGGSCGPPGILRKGGRGGQGGQWIQGSAHWSQFADREWVVAGRPVIKTRPFNPYTFHMFGQAGWDDMLWGETRGYGQDNWSIDDIDNKPPDPRYFVSDDPPPGAASKFGKITALGGGMGFVSTSTDCGSGGDGGDVGPGGKDERGQPGKVPDGFPWPPAEGGNTLAPNFPWGEDKAGLPAANWQDPRTPGWLWYGDNSYVWHAGAGGGGGSSSWRYYLSHSPVVQAGYGGNGSARWGGGGGGGGSGENSRCLYGGEGGHAGAGCVAIITTAAPIPPYLRMVQRNDGIGVARHPRLAGTGVNNPTSRQLGNPRRLAKSNTYLQERTHV